LLANPSVATRPRTHGSEHEIATHLDKLRAIMRTRR
jgi:hypothetical protein